MTSRLSLCLIDPNANRRASRTRASTLRSTMPRTSSRLAKIEEENKAAEEANKRELEKLRAVLASKEKKTKKPAKTKTVSKKSRKVAAEKAGQLLTVVQMLKKKLLAPGPITLDHHKSKPTRITKKVRAHSDRARRTARARRAC